MLDKERISKLKKGVLIVNNARGALVDTQAVADACTSGHIGGKTIARKSVIISRHFPIMLNIHLSDLSGYSGDVWFPQPAPKDHPWRYMPNQAMTPHISGTTIDAQVLYISILLSSHFQYITRQRAS